MTQKRNVITLQEVIDDNEAEKIEICYDDMLHIMNEKKGIVEFLDAGGFISFDHDNLLINMRLYRDNIS